MNANLALQPASSAFHADVAKPRKIGDLHARRHETPRPLRRWAVGRRRFAAV